MECFVHLSGEGEVPRRHEGEVVRRYKLAMCARNEVI